MKYSVSIFWSEKRQKFVALVPEFANLHAFGDSQEQAAAQAALLLESLLEGLAEEGAAPPEPRLLPEHSGQVRLNLPKTLHTRLVLEAERQGVPLEAHITAILSREQGESDTLKKLEARVARLEETPGN